MKIYTEKQFEKELERRMYEREKETFLNDRFRRLEEKIEKILYPEEYGVQNTCPEFDVPNTDRERIRAHCNLEENARLIAQILDFDDEGMVFDWYEQHIAQAIEWYSKYTVEKADLKSEAVDLCKEYNTGVAKSDGDFMYRLGYGDALLVLLSKFGIDITEEVRRVRDEPGNEPDAADL